VPKLTLPCSSKLLLACAAITEFLTPAVLLVATNTAWKAPLAPSASSQLLVDLSLGWDPTTRPGPCRQSSQDAFAGDLR
jgi:hypothetical protein